MRVAGQAQLPASLPLIENKRSAPDRLQRQAAFPQPLVGRLRDDRGRSRSVGESGKERTGRYRQVDPDGRLVDDFSRLLGVNSMQLAPRERLRMGDPSFDVPANDLGAEVGAVME